MSLKSARRSLAAIISGARAMSGIPFTRIAHRTCKAMPTKRFDARVSSMWIEEIRIQWANGKRNEGWMLLRAW